LNTSPLPSRQRHGLIHALVEHRVGGRCRGALVRWPWRRSSCRPAAVCQELLEGAQATRPRSGNGSGSAAAPLGSKATRPLSTVQNRGRRSAGPELRARHSRPPCSAGISAAGRRLAATMREEACCPPRRLKLNVWPTAAGARQLGRPRRAPDRRGQAHFSRAAISIRRPSPPPPRGPAGRARAAANAVIAAPPDCPAKQRRALPATAGRRRKADPAAGTTFQKSTAPSSARQRQIQSVSPAETPPGLTNNNHGCPPAR